MLPDFPSDLFTVKFILGQQAPVEGLNPGQRISRAKLAKDVQEEMAKFGDMVMLDVSARRESPDARLSTTSTSARRTSTSSGSQRSTPAPGRSRAAHGSS